MNQNKNKQDITKSKAFLLGATTAMIAERHPVLKWILRIITIIGTILMLLVIAWFMVNIIIPAWNNS